MKKILMAVAFAGLSSMAYGAPTQACTATPGSTFFIADIALANLNPEGYICGDKLFTNFTGTAPTGSIDFTTITPNLYRIEYLPTDGSTGTAFTLSFDVSVNTGTDRIFSVIGQMFTNAITGDPLPNTTSATFTATGGGAPSNALLTGNVGDQDSVILFAGGVTSTTVAFSFTPGENGALQSYQVNVFENQTPTVPEPGSMALLGSGLVGLGLLARKRRK